MPKQRKRDGLDARYQADRYSTYDEPMTMMSDEKFVVELYYRNYALFPDKHANQVSFRVGEYSNQGVFQTTVHQAFTTKWTNKIFAHYLDKDYQRLQPQLGIVAHDRVGISILVSDFSELETVLYTDPLLSVRHIGEPVRVVEVIPVTE